MTDRRRRGSGHRNPLQSSPEPKHPPRPHNRLGAHDRHDAGPPPRRGQSTSDPPPRRPIQSGASWSADRQDAPRRMSAWRPMRRFATALGRGSPSASRFRRPRGRIFAAAVAVVAVASVAGLVMRSAESAPPLAQTGFLDTAAAQAGETASSETIPEQAPPPTSLASVSTALDSPGVAAEAPVVPPTSAPQAPAEPDEVDWEQLSRSVVQLQTTECGQAGSGIIIGNGDLVLTNSHVVRSESSGRVCGIVVGFTSRFDKPPDGWQSATLVADDPRRDLAVVQIAGAAPAGHPSLEVQRDDLALGEEITTLGYPGFGHSQDTLTFTAGRFSGTTVGDGYELLKTDALLDAGVSGGGVFDAQGRLIGLAVGGFEGEGGYLGLVIGGSEVLRFLARHDLL
ncbi:MAG: hypothetical protein F4Z53_11525 [Acidimicrobiales bacterium]|nr:hypothetical protein [Acidimicrobiales bacterium]MYD33710.1 hypothetical protein [Acidimicrobiales bacterium]MYI09771.1 hypothetical protein [Acidimicrobiales bacterium]